jgi:hypothetical protein
MTPAGVRLMHAMFDSPGPHGRRWVVILFLLAALLRTGWVAARYSGERASVLQYPDEEAYCQVARSLWKGEGLRDEFGYRATYMPGYPAFLSLFVGWQGGLFWARTVQALLGACVAPALYLLACRWISLARMEGDVGGGADGHVCVLAGLAAVFDPFLLFFSGLLLTETLFAVVLTVAWLVLVSMCRPNRRLGILAALLAGLALWACIMLRPSAAVLVPLAVIAVVICRRFDKGGLVAAVVMVAVVGLGLSPWAARNHAVIGQWQWLTTRGGISLYDGLQPGATGASDLADTKTMPQVQGLGEVEWDRYFRDQAWSAVRENPGRLVRLAWLKFRRTWSPWPNVENLRGGVAATVSAGWTILLLLLAACGGWSCRRSVSAWIVLLLPVVAFTMIHMVYVGSLRYRVPFMPLVMVLSAVGLVEALSALYGRRRTNP